MVLVFLIPRKPLAVKVRSAVSPSKLLPDTSFKRLNMPTPGSRLASTGTAIVVCDLAGMVKSSAVRVRIAESPFFTFPLMSLTWTLCDGLEKFRFATAVMVGPRCTDSTPPPVMVN